VVPIVAVMILFGSSMYYFYAIIGHDPTLSFDPAKPTWLQTPMEFLIIVTMIGYEVIRPLLNKYLESQTPQSHTEEKLACLLSNHHNDAAVRKGVEFNETGTHHVCSSKYLEGQTPQSHTEEKLACLLSSLPNDKAVRKTRKKS